ncbi:PfkB family carbohydrate kinase [Patescibacteria group bacterium]
METDKIISLENLIKKLEYIKKTGEKIIHCHGCFDLIHPGHIKHFQAAKKLGDILVVTVTSDRLVNKGPGRPVFNQDLRMETVAAIGCVDFVVLNDDSDSVSLITTLKPDYFVKDQEFQEAAWNDPESAIYRERIAVESVGGKFHATTEIRFSSSRLLGDFFGTQSESAVGFLSSFRDRYAPEEIIERFELLKNLKVLVIGDAIIDVYSYVDPMGKSTKANDVIACNYLSEETFAGGIMACANHLAGFCEQVDMLTCLGKKGRSYHDFIVSNLKDNVSPLFLFREDAPTVCKRRFIDEPFLNKIFELYYFDDRMVFEDVENEALEVLQNIQDYDLVLVSDFGHGFLSPELINLICQKSNFLALNVQTNTGNFGYNLVTKYPRADFVCIDRPEVSLACHKKGGNYEEMLSFLRKKLSCQNIIMTGGHESTWTLGPEGFGQVPIFSSKVVDTVGAGCAFLSVVSPCAFWGWPTELLAFVGNVVGALAVGIVGNRSSVEPKDFFRFLTTLLK